MSTTGKEMKKAKIEDLLRNFVDIKIMLNDLQSYLDRDKDSHSMCEIDIKLQNVMKGFVNTSDSRITGGVFSLFFCIFSFKF